MTSEVPVALTFIPGTQFTSAIGSADSVSSAYSVSAPVPKSESLHLSESSKLQLLQSHPRDSEVVRPSSSFSAQKKSEKGDYKHAPRPPVAVKYSAPTVASISSLKPSQVSEPAGVYPSDHWAVFAEFTFRN